MLAFEKCEHELHPAEARDAIDHRDADVIDVRQPDERYAGRIPDSRHINMQLLAVATDTISRERPVIFYCRKGARSRFVARAFRSAGWDAYNVEGGLVAWVDDGQPLDPPDGRVAED